MASRSFLRYGRSFFTGFVVGLPVYVTITDFGFCIARVDGISMQPSLNPVAKESDVVFLNRWVAKGFKKFNRGDVVSLISPSEPDVKLIKRIIGLEGDLIRTLGYKKPYVVVPSGHCWIEGDHRGRSFDSNTFGPVSVGLINGVATRIIWPPKRWKKIDSKIPKGRHPMKDYHRYTLDEKEDDRDDEDRLENELTKSETNMKDKRSSDKTERADEKKTDVNLLNRDIDPLENSDKDKDS